MSNHTLNKKCPNCHKKRKFRASPNHTLIGNWQKRNNLWVCPWCIARETPDGVRKMIEERQQYLNFKRVSRKNNK